MILGFKQKFHWGEPMIAKGKQQEVFESNVRGFFRLQEMKKLKLTPQLRIRACDRILRRLYTALKRSMKHPATEDQVKNEDDIQERINYWEEWRERISVSIL